jgi:sugar phosphate isomerase/epimerase
LGTTSYILPDDLVPNVTFLADRVDDVELVLFESDEVSNLPDADVIESLAILACEYDLTYTVHLPLDIDLGSCEASVRRRSLEKCRKVIHLTQGLHPFAYVLHLYGCPSSRESAVDLSSWTAALDESIAQLLDEGPAPDAFCVETLAYPYEHVWDLVQRHGLSVCLDVGHILLNGYDLLAYLETYLTRCRVMHLHGIREGRDHCDIGGLSDSTLKVILNELQATAAPERVLTLEVFNLPDFERSLDILRNFT